MQAYRLDPTTRIPPRVQSRLPSACAKRARRAGASQGHPLNSHIQMSAHPRHAVMAEADLLDLSAEFGRRRDRRQALRLRIDRRARELAERDQVRYFRAMVNDLMHGRLAEELVPYWEPTTGGVGLPHQRGA